MINKISKSAHACMQAWNETTRIFSGETKVKFSMLNYPFSILNNPYADLYKIRYVLVYYETLNVTLPTVQCCPFWKHRMQNHIAVKTVTCAKMQGLY